jgi:8-oxo-dGTP diphosphatase
MSFSVAAVIRYKGKYLFQKRDNKINIFYPNFYGLFGGESNKNEKPKQVIKRELFEEINIKFNKIQHLITLKLESKIFNPKTASIFNRYIFICVLPKNFKKNINLKEGQNYKFIDINQINKKKISPFDYAVTKYYDLLKKNKKIIPKKYLK